MLWKTIQNRIRLFCFGPTPQLIPFLRKRSHFAPRSRLRSRESAIMRQSARYCRGQEIGSIKLDRDLPLNGAYDSAACRQFQTNAAPNSMAIRSRSIVAPKGIEFDSNDKPSVEMSIVRPVPVNLPPAGMWTQYST